MDPIRFVAVFLIEFRYKFCLWTKPKVKRIYRHSVKALFSSCSFCSGRKKRKREQHYERLGLNVVHNGEKEKEYTKMLFAISALSASICAFVSYLCCYLGIVEIRVSSSSGSLTSTNKVIDYFGVEGALSSYSILLYIFLTISLPLAIVLTVLAFLRRSGKKTKWNKAIMTLAILLCVFIILAFVFVLIFKIQNDEFHDYVYYDHTYYGTYRTHMVPFHLLLAFTIAAMCFSLLALFAFIVCLSKEKATKIGQNMTEMSLHATTNSEKVEAKSADTGIPNLTNLDDLFALYQKGAITEEEYKSLKNRVLNGDNN